MAKVRFPELALIQPCSSRLRWCVTLRNCNFYFFVLFLSSHRKSEALMRLRCNSVCLSVRSSVRLSSEARAAAVAHDLHHRCCAAHTTVSQTVLPP